MRFFALPDARTLRLATACAALLASTSTLSFAQDDPPDQAGRISWASGTVSVQPMGSEDWGQAYVNLPMGPGDRVFTDSDGWAEIQVGQTYMRMGPNTDVTLVSDTPSSIGFGVAQGSVHLHTFGLWQDQWLNVSTPNGNAQFAEIGELRVDVLPADGATVFTNFGQGAYLTGAGGYEQQVGNMQSIELAGTNPVYPQWLQPSSPDRLDAWSQQRDQWATQAASYRYVSPEVPGAADLDANGDWVPDSDYGPMWFPRNVSEDWEPYHNGHWVNRDPWGWVWVEDEPWGYAPFHYGRWVSYRGRWGWIPGPREGHPVWSPALVVFAGGIHVGGIGVSAWFPLGPGEPYRPSYPCSPRYIDRVNISNIHESRVVHVQNTYVNLVNVTNVTNITYLNRTSGVTAMRNEDFAAGRPARQAAVAVDAHQFDHVQVVTRPEPPPTRQSLISRPVAHPMPVAANRPSFINGQGKLVVAQPGAQPVAPPVKPLPQVRTLPGRTVVAAPVRGNFQQPAQTQQGPVQPVGRPIPPIANQPRQNPNQPQPNTPDNQPSGHQPVAPGVQPVGRPIPPSANPPRQNPDQPQPTPYSQPSGHQPVAPGVQPVGRPATPPANKQEATPNQPPAGTPHNQPADRPNTGAQPANRPTPPQANRQEPTPQQADKHDKQEQQPKDNKNQKRDEKKHDN